MKRAAFYTLGCKVNQYETEAISEMFEKAGYKIVDFEDEADVYVINTCTVTNLSDRKSRQMIRRAKRNNENSIVIVIGCYAQTAPEEVSKIEGVNLVVGTKDRSRILEYLKELETSGGRRNYVGDIMKTRNLRNWVLMYTRSVQGLSLRYRKVAISFAHTALFPMQEGL